MYRSQINNSKKSLLLYYSEKICVASPRYWCMAWLTVTCVWVCGSPQSFLEIGMEADEECLGIILTEVVGGKERLPRQREQDEQSSPGEGEG